MIVTRSPLRISLGGGGTDLPSYYRKFGGFLISAAIDKYVYVSVNKTFTQGITLKYSKIEKVDSVGDVSHPIVREALSALQLSSPQLEITTMADIPAGTGLGSSGSFTTGLLKALFGHQRKHMQQEELAELACHIEIDRLGENIGKQDQYIAAFGGITCFTFCENDKVIAEPLITTPDTLHELEDNLLLFFTGFSRSASEILTDQKVRSESDDTEMMKNLHYVKTLGQRSKLALERGNTFEFGEIMHEHWEHKKRRSKGMSNSRIDEWYNVGIENGAIGGKLVGAGGGGFLMFLATDRVKLRSAMANSGLEEVRFKFDFEGTKVVATS
jgi:D-glycero-alpha-D-manno-heptose-7-phosphate kinase